MEEIAHVLEVLLFTSKKPLSLRTLSELLGKPPARVQEGIEALRAHYAHHGLRVRQDFDRYYLDVSDRHRWWQDQLASLAEEQDLGDAAWDVETLESIPDIDAAAVLAAHREQRYADDWAALEDEAVTREVPLSPDGHPLVTAESEKPPAAAPEAPTPKAEPTPAKAEPTPPKAESTPAKAEPTPAKAESTPAKAEPTPAATKAAQPRAESTSAPPANPAKAAVRELLSALDLTLKRAAMLAKTQPVQAPAPTPAPQQAEAKGQEQAPEPEPPQKAVEIEERETPERADQTVRTNAPQEATESETGSEPTPAETPQKASRTKRKGGKRGRRSKRRR